MEFHATPPERVIGGPSQQVGREAATVPQWFDDELRLMRRIRTRPWLSATVAAIAVATLAAMLWLADLKPAAIALVGVCGLMAFIGAGVTALRRVLSYGHPVIAVARAVLEEAIGTRLSVLLVMLVVVGLPTLPLVLDPAERLAYRLQFFINWSLSGAFVLLAIVTIALCCGSVCGDIDTRRIHMSLSKPLRRWEYLLGKWLGVTLLNLLLVTCVGIGTYTFAQALRRTSEADAADRRAVEEQVLTARASARPVHPEQDKFELAVTRAIAEIRKDDPATFDKDAAGASQRIRSQQICLWHTVTADLVASFLFTDLAAVKDRARVMQLRLEPFADNSSGSRAEIQFALWLNERAYPMRNGIHEDYILPSGQFHTLELPTSVIDDDGRLLITIANKNRLNPGDLGTTSISFKPGEGLELLYRVASFEQNMGRAAVVIWAKLTMLAAMAIAAAAWLSMPVAMLSGCMVFISAVANSFFADAVDIYTGLDLKNATFISMVKLRLGILLDHVRKFAWWDTIKTVGSYAADCLLAVVPSFGHYDSITQVATGRLVGVQETLLALVLLAGVYPVILLVLGWWLLERRDLVSSTT